MKNLLLVPAVLLGMGMGTGCVVFDEKIDPDDRPPACFTNAQCSTELEAPAVCVDRGTAAATCRSLLSEDCTVLTGDHLDDKAVLIASLLSTTGGQAATNIARQEAAIMAVEQINASNASNGILLSTAPGDTRKLVMVSCDEIADLPRVARHLVEELKVTAIVGPNLSQDTIDLTTGDPSRNLPSSAANNVVLLTPTGVAAAIATVPDNGMSFMMVPSDIQRIKPLIDRFHVLEDQLQLARGPGGSVRRDIKLALLYRDDALGQGTRDGLATAALTVNDDPLATARNNGKFRQDGYSGAATEHTALVDSYLEFEPDIIIVVGTGEAAKLIIGPLEQRWIAEKPGTPRPFYISIDSLKTPELQTLTSNTSVLGASAADDLRKRMSGTGITAKVGSQPSESTPILEAFKTAYGDRWKDATGAPKSADVSGLGPTYDAVYTIALALVGKPGATSLDLIGGMPRLTANTATCQKTPDNLFFQAPCFSLTEHSSTLYTNMTMLLEESPVTEIGTSGRLEWDSAGAKASGLIEIWCITGTNPAKPGFANAGITFDVKTKSYLTQTFQACP